MNFVGFEKTASGEGMRLILIYTIHHYHNEVYSNLNHFEILCKYSNSFYVIRPTVT